MRFRASSTWPILPHHVFRPHHISHPAAALLRLPAALSRALHATPSSGGGGGAQGNYLLLPGATMATILMLGILHARRLYDDKKSLQGRRRLRIVVEDMKEKGIEPEFSPGYILEDSTFSSHLMLLGVPDDNGSPSHVKAFSLQSKGLGTSFWSSFPSEMSVLCALSEICMLKMKGVVLEGQWEEGFIALAAIGATNVGSIQLFIESELQTNSPRRRWLQSEPPDEHE